MLNIIKKVENGIIHLEKRCNVCCSTTWIDKIEIKEGFNTIISEINKFDICKNCSLVHNVDKKLKN